MGIIYLIRNLINGKVYVGQTVRTLAVRFNAHKQDCRSGANRPLYRSVRKYGWENFSINPVSHASSQDDLDNLEHLWIVLFRAADRNYGYNLTWGGEHGMRTEEVIDKLRASHLGQVAWNKGKKASPEHVLANKLGHAGQTNPHMIGNKHCKGSKRSAESKEKYRQAALRRPSMSQEVRDKISATLKTKGIKPLKPGPPKGERNPNWKGRSAAKSWSTRRAG